MTREDRLADLLERWEASTETNPPTIAEFCRDCPDLEDDFRKLIGKMPKLNAVLGSTVARVEGGSADPDEAAPSQTGRYRPLKYHRKGGLGKVFLAEDNELGRKVALKCIRKLHARDGMMRQQFLVEAEITGRLEHPGIVPVYGLGRDADGSPFYAMRFISGRTLEEEVQRFHASTDDRNVELRRLLRHFIAVCETLAYAHDRGVIHRDLKPANIMIGPYGETLVVDWGLAKQVATGESEEDTYLPMIEALKGVNYQATFAGAAKGSPAFMSPEQARGDWPSVGPASDQYSLGSTLFAILTGKLPYNGRTIREVLDKVAAGNCLSPRAVNPAAPAALDAICRKAMAREPGNRYANVREFARDLERWLADEPVQAWREPFTVRARRWLRRHRTLVTSSVAVLLVGLMSAIGFAVQERENTRQVTGAFNIVSEKNALLEKAQGDLLDRNFDLEKANKALTAAKKEVEGERDRATENFALAQRNLYPARMNVVANAINEGLYEYAWGVLRQTRPEPGFHDDYRGFEWYQAWNFFNRPEKQVLETAMKPTRLKLSADGKRIAIANSKSVKVVRVSDNTSLFETSIKDKGDIPMTADGRLIASPEGKNIEVWEVPEEGLAKPLWTLKGFTKSVEGIAISPRGTRLAAIGDMDRVIVWDLKTGNVETTLEEFRDKDSKIESTLSQVKSISCSPRSDLFGFLHKKKVVFWNAEARQRFFAQGMADDYEHLCFTDADTLCLWKSPTQVVSYRTLLQKDFLKPNGQVVAVQVPLNSDDPIEGVWEFPLGTRASLSVVLTRRLLRGYCTAIYEDKPLFALKATMWPTTPAAFPISGTSRTMAFASTPDAQLWARADDRGRIILLKGSEALEPDCEVRHPLGNYAVKQILFLPDGRQITLADDNSVRCMKPDGEEEWALAARDTNNVADFKGRHRSIALSADGTMFAYRDKDDVFIVDIRDPKNKKDVGSVKLDQKSIFGSNVAMAFLPGRPWLVVANELTGNPKNAFARKNSAIGVWDFEQKRLVSNLEVAAFVDTLTVSTDGGRLAAAGGQGLVEITRITPTGLKHEVLLRGQGYFEAVRFSPDGKYVAAGNTDGEIWVWPLADPSQLRRLPIHQSSIKALAFSPDGRALVSGSQDGRIRFLSLTLFQDIYSLQMAGPVHALAFSADGTRLTVGGQGGAIREYHVTTAAKILETARAKYKAEPESRERLRDLFLAIWDAYLERSRNRDAKAGDALAEALALGEALAPDTRAHFAAWLDAFRAEVAKARPPSGG